MEARAVLTKYGTAFLPLFNEIDSVVKNAVKEDRNELSDEEIAHVLKISGRMVYELRKELEKDFKQEKILDKNHFFKRYTFLSNLFFAKL